MAKVLQLRHGSTAEHANFTGTLAEVTVDTDLKTIRVHDGATEGGHALAKLAEVVRSINSTTPDSNGNVNVPTYTHPNSGVTAGTYNKVTVNAQGHVTGASNVSFATVATSGKYSDLSGRPTIPATPKAYVTATGKSGTSWYRTWSDGFKEIGFIYSANMLNGNEQTVTLPWSMPSNNYHISYTPLTDSTGNGNFIEQTFYRKSQTTTKFVFQQAWLAKTGLNFYVCGY